IFIGMESIDPTNLADVNKGFNKPGEYAEVLERLAKHNVFAITSFIFGMDNDTPGVAERTLEQIHKWPPGLPVFGQLTPFPATPLYARLQASGRLERPKHWLDFSAFVMAHRPMNMTISEARMEVDQAWTASYSAKRNAEALRSIPSTPIQYRIGHLLARLFFRGIYFPQMGKWPWIRLILQNRTILLELTKEGVSAFKRHGKEIIPQQTKIASEATDKLTLG